MAHIENSNGSVSLTLTRQGGAVTFFACGIDVEANSPYEVAVLRGSRGSERTVSKVHASKGKSVAHYRTSRLDSDLKAYQFTIDRVEDGDLIVILRNNSHFSSTVTIVSRSFKNNESLLLHSTGELRKKNVLFANGPIVPVKAQLFPMSTSPRGLAIHVTAGEGTAAGFVNGWGSSGIGAHFIIERSGRIVQCVALTLRGEAQAGPDGDPNMHWLSVEFVVKMNNAGTDGFFESSQLLSGRRLFNALQGKYGFRNGLAAPLLSDQGRYGEIAKQLSRELGVTGANSRADAVKSSGLSCHRWLGPGHACPGLIGLQMMPVILGIREPADFEF